MSTIEFTATPKQIRSIGFNFAYGAFLGITTAKLVAAIVDKVSEVIVKKLSKAGSSEEDKEEE